MSEHMYERIAGALREQMISGSLQPGDRLPTQDALSESFEVSRIVARRALDIRPGVEVEDEATVWRELDFVAGLLADGRPYLSGERFGAADLTFGALSAPLVVPAIYGVPLPQPELMAARTRDLVERARQHPAGRFALRLIAEQRHSSVPQMARLPARS